jgi:glycosyltransferase involved in cell wall biosynthesis
VLIVSGIWPPDVGGPASHAPELADFLVARGHRVEVLTTAAEPPALRKYPVHWISRRLPAPLRYVWGAVLAAQVARYADVVYSTGMFGRSRVGAGLARKPRVLKLTGDPAYERATRYRLTRLPLDDFQRSRSLRTLWLKAFRNWALSGAERYICPSESLARLAARWRFVDRKRIVALPNPVSVPSQRNRAELRRRHGFTGPTLAFAGRLAPQKSLDVGLQALAQCEGIDLVIAGDGPERPALENLARGLALDRRVRFVGAQPRPAVFELLAAADAELLSSSWENFPHSVVESLATGTPVIATDVGGVGEVVADGVNGLLVPPRDPPALAAAIRRFFGDEALQARLRAEAPKSVGNYAPERIYGRIEEILQEAGR